jgi:hypothetical protein
VAKLLLLSLSLLLLEGEPEVQVDEESSVGAWTQDLYTTPIAKQHREVAASRLAPDHKI